VNGTSNLTPGQVREGLRARAKRALVAASSNCDAAWRSTVAATIGVTRQRIDQWLALDDDAQVSVADAMSLPQPMRMAAAQLIAGDGYMLAALPDIGDSSSDLDLVMRAQKESGDVIATHLAALRDGRMCRAEGAQLEREADEAIAALLTVRERARQAQREVVLGVTGLRAVKP
jgi:hypothetical protein